MKLEGSTCHWANDATSLETLLLGLKGPLIVADLVDADIIRKLWVLMDEILFEEEAR